VQNPVDRADSLLTVPSDLAVKLGLAKAEARSVQDLAADRGLDIVADLSPGTGEKFVELLAGGLPRTVLLVIFLLSLYIALHAPGHGMAEAVALISLGFLVGIPLLTGYAQWWELVMIMLGLVLLALEMFVIPGFGVAGVAGIALLAVGLVLTFVGNAPGVPGIWKLPAMQQGLRTGLTAVVSGLLVSVVLAAWVRRYLPKLPYFSRLILTAPSGAASAIPAPLHDPNDVWPFAGTTGVATTALRPGGEAEFPYADDRRVAAVVSDGGYVEAGAKIVVREARGNRVVVRAV
jgi:membrane-bound serine protease (ClpP class)